MRKKLPYFCWYPGDFETDEKVKLMTIDEIGLYILCLSHCWINGSLPADPIETARALKIPKSQFLKAWPRVEPCFDKRAEDGRLLNQRQERERSAAHDKSEKNRKAASVKWSKSDANIMRTHTGRIDSAMQQGGAMLPAYGSGSEASEIEIKKDGEILSPQLDEMFVEYRRLFEQAASQPTLPSDFYEAFRAWNLLDPMQRHKAIEGVKLRHSMGAFLGHSPASFLWKHEYLRAVTVRSRPKARSAMEGV